jgi:lipopolysaccharide export system ATP-binding protein
VRLHEGAGRVIVGGLELGHERLVDGDRSLAARLLAMRLELLGVPWPDASARVGELLEEFGLDKLHAQRAETLSGGERRRLEIARALVTEPRFLLLDEPFAGIDPITVLDMQRLIRHLRQKGYGILITDHNVRDTLKITDRASIIRDGKVFASGDPNTLAQDPLVRQVYLGEEFQL